MDGEFITILAVGLLFILGAVGYLVWQRRQADGDDTSSKSKTGPAQKKREAAAPKQEKKSLLAALRRTKDTKGDKAGPSAQETKELEELIASGHVDDAARVAMRLQLWDKAAQLYLKANQPGNAAHCAKRAGKLEMAAEFYEKADDVSNAARMWETAGNTQRARELLGDPSSDGDDSAEDTVVQISKELRVEIDAATEKKDHMRAAELYEQAGDMENAAEAFAAFAQTARRPEVYAEKIQTLSPRVAHKLLRIATKGRPPGADSADLYRRLALLQIHFGNEATAMKTLQRLLRAVPEAEEAAQLLEKLRAEGAAVESDAGADDAGADDGGADDAGADDAGRGEAGTDEAVAAATSGPTVAELVDMIAEQDCNLGNIEVYYRLGLACLAAGKPEDAARAFRAVDETSPGYRDVSSRLPD